MPGFDAAAVDTYAWSAPPRFVSTTQALDPSLLERVRVAIDEELERIGTRRVDKHRASFLVEASLDLELETQSNDPYYSLYIAEKYEEGRLTVSLYDTRTSRLAWRGECRHRLRYVARTMGGLSPRFVPTSEARDWQIEAMVERVVRRLGS